jgi:hypothetical protein
VENGQVIYGALNQSLQTRETVAFPNTSFNGSFYNYIGAFCSQIAIVTSDKNFIEGGSSNIFLGTNLFQGTDNYTLTFDGVTGAANAYDSVTVQADAGYAGKQCNNNTFKSGCTNLSIEGSDNNSNEFASNVSNINTSIDAVITGCSFLVSSGSVLNIGTPIANVVANRVSPDGSLWFKTIDNAGVESAPTKVV